MSEKTDMPYRAKRQIAKEHLAIMYLRVHNANGQHDKNITKRIRKIGRILLHPDVMDFWSLR